MKNPFKIRGWIMPVLAIAGVVFALFSVLGRPTVSAKEPLVPPPQSSFGQSVAGIGVVEPKSELISIGVELPGVVRKLHVKVGDEVKKGDPLFSLDERDIDAQINTLESSLVSTKIQAEDASAQFAIVNSVSDKRAVAKDDFNRRKFAKELALARIKEIKAQLETAKTTKERLTIKAPITGQVLEVNIRPGEFATAGALASPLIRMGDVSTLHVRVEVDEENASSVKAQSPAKGFRRGDTKNAIPLQFVRFEPYIRPKQNLAVSGQRIDTRVLQVIYALPENHESVFVGQQLDVFIEDSAAEAK